jgi:hypothetical protein
VTWILWALAYVWENLRLVPWYWYGMLFCLFAGCNVGCRL